jgi:hypothetical protein
VIAASQAPGYHGDQSTDERASYQLQSSVQQLVAPPDFYTLMKVVLWAQSYLQGGWLEVQKQKANCELCLFLVCLLISLLLYLSPKCVPTPIVSLCAALTLDSLFPMYFSVATPFPPSLPAQGPWRGPRQETGVPASWAQVCECLVPRARADQLTTGVFLLPSTGHLP